MTYPAIDGTVLVSNPNQLVTYSCPSQGHAEGVFFALETTSAVNKYGIQQIRINYIVTNGVISYTITESTDVELEIYLESIKLLENAN